MADNSTEDLEVRVTLLEDDVTDLEADVMELRLDNSQQDDRFLIIEGNVAGNSDDIDGKFEILSSGVIKCFPNMERLCSDIKL